MLEVIINNEIDGGLRPLLCGSIWRRCAARLRSDCTREAAHTYFTTTYPNVMQCAGGLQDGATRCAQLLNMLHDPSKSRPLNPVYVPSPGYMSALTNVTFQHANSFIIGTAVINTLDYPRRGVTPANTQETIGSPPPLVNGYRQRRRLLCFRILCRRPPDTMLRREQTVTLVTSFLPLPSASLKSKGTVRSSKTPI